MADSQLSQWMRALVAYVRSGQPDLTNRQMALLLISYITPGPHTVRSLASQLGVSKPVITRALNTLGSLGYLRRERDDNDRRNHNEPQPSELTNGNSNSANHILNESSVTAINANAIIINNVPVVEVMKEAEENASNGNSISADVGGGEENSERKNDNSRPSSSVSLNDDKLSSFSRNSMLTRR